MFITYEHNPEKAYPYSFMVNNIVFNDNIQCFETDDAPKDEVRQWVKDTIGKGRDKVYFWEWGKTDIRSPLEVRFKTPEDASTFKLRWC